MAQLNISSFLYSNTFGKHKIDDNVFWVFRAECTKEIISITSYGMHMIKVNIHFLMASHLYVSQKAVWLFTSDLNQARAVLLWHTRQGNSLRRGMEGAKLKYTLYRLLLDHSWIFQIHPSDFDFCCKPSALSLHSFSQLSCCRPTPTF